MPVATATMLSLMLGKPIGIFCFSWLAVKVRWAQLPEGVTWKLLLGGGMLGGIGFTMAIFIAGLALEDDLLNHSQNRHHDRVITERRVRYDAYHPVRSTAKGRDNRKPCFMRALCMDDIPDVAMRSTGSTVTEINRLLCFTPIVFRN